MRVANLKQTREADEKHEITKYSGLIMSTIYI